MNKDALTALAIYGAVGVQLALSVVVGLLGGAWLDKEFESSPWITVTGLIMGAIAGFWNLIRILNWKTDKISQLKQ